MDHINRGLDDCYDKITSVDELGLAYRLALAHLSCHAYWCQYAVVSTCADTAAAVADAVADHEV